MKHWKAVPGLFLTAVVFAGCGAKTDPPSEPAVEMNNSAAQKSEKQAVEPPVPDKRTVPEQKPDKQTPAAEEKPKAPTTPLYKMNKVYNFVPIGEQTPKKVVLLTFDDGPKEKEMLTSILDTLDAHRAKAIFFVNGYRVKANPDLLTLIKDRGQTIGNHSWDHIDLRKEKEAVIVKQIDDVTQIIEKLTGQRPRFFRPPFGSGGDVVKAYVKKQDMLYMTWSDGSLDWDIKATKKNPDLIIKSVLDQLHPGANILMHELPWTADALNKLLTALEQKGYGFIDPASIAPPDAAPAAK